MSNALYVKARVLPGKRIEITAPELNEEDAVDVILVLPEKTAAPQQSILEFLDSRPPGPVHIRRGKSWSGHCKRSATLGIIDSTAQCPASRW